MTFKNCARKAQKDGERYIHRRNDATCRFDVVKYNPSLLEEEDLWADDWEVDYQ